MAEDELSSFENITGSEAINSENSKNCCGGKKKKKTEVRMRYKQFQKQTERTFCVCHQADSVTLNQGHKRRATRQYWEWVNATRPRQLIDVLNNQYLIVKGNNRYCRGKRMGNANFSSVFRRTSNVAGESQYPYKKMHKLKCRKNANFQPDTHEKDRAIIIGLGERRGALSSYQKTGVCGKVMNMGQSGKRSSCIRETNAPRRSRIYQVESKFVDYGQKRQMLTQQLVNADSRIRDWDLSNILPHSDSSSVASVQKWQSKFTSPINKKYFPEKVQLRTMDRSHPMSAQVKQSSYQHKLKNSPPTSGLMLDSRKGSGNMPLKPFLDMSTERNKPCSECWDCWMLNRNLSSSPRDDLEDSSDSDISKEIKKVEKTLGYILPFRDKEKTAVNSEHSPSSSQLIHKINLIHSDRGENAHSSTNSTQYDSTKNLADTHQHERHEHLSHNSPYEAGTKKADFSQQDGPWDLGHTCPQKSSVDSPSHQHGDTEKSKSQSHPQKHCSHTHSRSPRDSEKSRASPYVEISEDGLLSRAEELLPQECPFEHLSESPYESHGHYKELPSCTPFYEPVLRQNVKQKLCRANGMRASQSNYSVDEKFSSHNVHARDKSCFLGVQKRSPIFYAERNKQVPISNTDEKREPFLSTDKEICRLISSSEENGRLLAKEGSETLLVGSLESDTLLARGENERLLAVKENGRQQVDSKEEGGLTDEENGKLSAREEDERLLVRSEENERLLISSKENTLSISNRDNETKLVGCEENECLKKDREENEKFLMCREETGGFFLHRGDAERISVRREENDGLSVGKKGKLYKAIEEYTQLLFNVDENISLFGSKDDKGKLVGSEGNEYLSKDRKENEGFLVNRKEKERIFSGWAKSGSSLYDNEEIVTSIGDNEESVNSSDDNEENGRSKADCQILEGGKENRRLPFKSDVDKRFPFPDEGQGLFLLMHNQKGILNSENNTDLLDNEGIESLLCREWEKIKEGSNKKGQACSPNKFALVEENNAILSGNEIDKCSFYEEGLENFVGQCLNLKESLNDELNRKSWTHNKIKGENCLSNISDEKLLDETTDLCHSLPENNSDELLLLIKHLETRRSTTPQSLGRSCQAKIRECDIKGDGFPLQIEENYSRFEDIQGKLQRQRMNDTWTVGKANEKQTGQTRDLSQADKDSCKENRKEKESVKYDESHLVQNDNSLEVGRWPISYEEFGKLEDELKLFIDSWERNDFGRKYNSVVKEILQNRLSLPMLKTGNCRAACEATTGINTGKTTHSTSCCNSASDTNLDAILKGRGHLENFENSIGGCSRTHKTSNLEGASGNLNRFDNKRGTVFSVHSLQHLSPVSQSPSLSSLKETERPRKKKIRTKIRISHNSQKQPAKPTIRRKRSHSPPKRRRNKRTNSPNSSTRHQSPPSTTKVYLLNRKIFSHQPLQYSKPPICSKGKKKMLKKFRKTPIAGNVKPQIRHHLKTMPRQYQVSCFNSKKRWLFGRSAKKGTSADIDGKFGGTASRRIVARKKSISGQGVSRARPPKKKGTADIDKEFGGTARRRNVARKSSRSSQGGSRTRSGSDKKKFKFKKPSSKLGKKIDANLDFSQVRHRGPLIPLAKNKGAQSAPGYFEYPSQRTPEDESSCLCFFKFNHLRAKSFELLAENIYEMDQETLNRFACDNINTNTKSTMARDNWFRAKHFTPTPLELQVTWNKSKTHSNLAMNSSKKTSGAKSKKVSLTKEGQGKSVRSLRQSDAPKKSTHKQSRSIRKLGKNINKNMDATNRANPSGIKNFDPRISHGTRGRQSMDRRVNKLPESPKVRKRVKNKTIPLKNKPISIDATTQTCSELPEIPSDTLSYKSQIVKDKVVNLRNVIRTPIEEKKLDEYEMVDEPRTLNAESLTLFLMMSFPKLRY